ncbi:MAG: M56 family metallopeptidase [Planctomycetota bacterium]
MNLQEFSTFVGPGAGFNGTAGLDASMMDHVVWSFVQLSIVSGIVVLLAILLHFSLRRVIAPGWLYLLWVLVLLRFVMFAAPASPTSILNLIEQKEQAAQVIVPNQPGPETEFAEQDYVFAGVFADTEFGSFDFDHKAAGLAPQLRPLPQSGTDYFRVATCFLVLAWAAGVLLALVRLVVCAARVSGLVHRSLEAPDALEDQFTRIRRNVCPGQKARLRVTDEMQVPAMAGWLKPVVLIPAWCLKELDEQQKECVLTHELVHVRRRDNLVQLFSQLVLAFHWFNPLARVVCRFIDAMRELSCDRAAIRFLSDGISTGACGQYGRTILQVAERSLTDGESELVFARGFTGSDKKLIKERISMLVSPVSFSRTFHTIAGAVSLSFMVAVGFTAAQTAGEELPVVSASVEEAEVAGPQELQFVPDVAIAYLQEILLKEGEVTVITSDDVVLEVVVADPSTVSAETVEDDTVMLRGLEPGSSEVRITDSAGGVRLIRATVEESGLIRMTDGETQRMSFDFKVPEIRITDPEVLNVTPVSPDELLLQAEAPGATTIEVSDTDRNFRSFRVEVLADVSDLSLLINERFPQSEVSVTGRHDCVVLNGKVEQSDINLITAFAREHCDLPVMNQLISDDHVALKVSVFEVEAGRLSELGVEWSEAGDEAAPMVIESIADLYGKDAVTSNGVTIATNKEGDQIIELMDFLGRNNIARLVSQPVLVCKYDQAAQFMAGTEIPIVVQNASGDNEVQFRPVGTVLDLVPKQADDGMAIEFSVELSKLDQNLAGDTGQPGFVVRRINSGLKLADEEQLVIVFKKWSMGAEDENEMEMVFVLTPSELPPRVSESPEISTEPTPVDRPRGIYPEPLNMRR